MASIFRIADGGNFARMLSCREVDRLELLQRLGGESVLEDLDNIKAEFASFTPRAMIEAPFPMSEPPKVLLPTHREMSAQGNEHPNIEVPSETTHTESSVFLQIIEGEHIPEPATEPRKLQVKTVTSPDVRTRSPHQITDGYFCERKVMEFEEASNPARWPLPVGQIMGTDGAGCDVLSFASQEARETFRLGPIRDLNTVERFIEVKGRGNAGASIELRGNELSAAERYGNRYFLYRLFEEDDGIYELAILQNPLIHKEALQPAVHVAMQRTDAMLRFSLSGGLKKIVNVS